MPELPSGYSTPSTWQAMRAVGAISHLPAAVHVAAPNPRH
jgi:hypothetical protein